MIRNLPFEKYLEVKRNSFSSIVSNGQPIPITAKMQLGSDVDNYLNDPTSFKGDLSIVKPIAERFKAEVGILFDEFEKQISIFCDLVYDGYVLECKFRPDWWLLGHMIIENKCAKRIEDTMERFGYKVQTTGYCIPTGENYGMILSVSPEIIDRETKMFKVSKYEVNPANHCDWWQQQIRLNGRQIKQYV